MDKFRAVWEKVDTALFQILRHICAAILGALVAVGFSIFLIVYGIKLAQQGANNNMAGINVPYSFMYSALPVTGVLNIFAVLGHWVLGRKESK